MMVINSSIIFFRAHYYFSKRFYFATLKEIENNRVRFNNEEKNKQLHFMALKLDVLDTITDGEFAREVEEFE